MQDSATGPSTPKYQQFRAIRGIQLSTTTTEEEGVQGTSSSLAELEVEVVEGVTSEGRLQVEAAAEAAAAAAEAAVVAAAEAAAGEGESPDREP